MSFEIIEGSWQNTGGFGFLIGYKNFDDIVNMMLMDDHITEEYASELMDGYDGYQLQIDGYDSVNYFLRGNIEGICMYSQTVGGGHCAGLKYTEDTSREEEGDPWGLWFTTAQFNEARDNETELKGVDISHQWERTNELEPLDASLGGQWRLQKWLPKQSGAYYNDYRWSKEDTP